MKKVSKSTAVLMSGVVASSVLFGIGGLSAFAGKDLKCGDRVLEDRDELSVQTVLAISESGKYLLSDGEWYWDDYLKPAIDTQEHSGIKVGDTVMEFTSGKIGRRFMKVNKILTVGYFQLEDGKWYNPYYLTQTVQEFEAMKVGQQVLESEGQRSVQKIAHLSADGVAQLEDGEIYFTSGLRTVTYAKSFETLSLNSTVTPKYEDKFSVQKVTALSTDGMIGLDNGVWYRADEVSRLTSEYNGYKVGDRVIDFRSESAIVTITHASEYGIFRLSNGEWRYASQFERISCGPTHEVESHSPCAP